MIKICARVSIRRVITTGALVLPVLLLLLLTQQPWGANNQLSKSNVTSLLNVTAAFGPILTSSERWIELQLLQTIDRVFKHYNVTYVIYGGTLMGSYRHMGLVPWDDDIDVLVNITCRQQLPGMFKHMAPSLSMFSTSGIEKVYDRLSRRTCQRCRWSWPYLDISYFEENQTHIWDHTITYTRRYVYPKFLTLPTHPRPLEHLWLPAPRDSLAFLQLTYGRTRTCVAAPWGYSHKLDSSVKSYRMPCQDLRDRVAFVHRQPCSAAAGSSISSDDACVQETLQLGSRVLRLATVAEPSFAINEPYALRLIENFTQPKHYPDTNLHEIM